MTDWADIDDDIASEFADISLERLGSGRYAVSASSAAAGCLPCPRCQEP